MAPFLFAPGPGHETRTRSRGKKKQTRRLDFSKRLRRCYVPLTKIRFCPPSSLRDRIDIPDSARCTGLWCTDRVTDLLSPAHDRAHLFLPLVFPIIWARSGSLFFFLEDGENWQHGRHAFDCFAVRLGSAFVFLIAVRLRSVERTDFPGIYSRGI